MAQTWCLEQWTNMDYFLISEPCTLSSMWSIIKVGRGFVCTFFRQNSNHFCMSAIEAAKPDPPKGIRIVLKKGCDWTKKCIAVYH